MYPGTTQNPNGKLRLNFEANPMAFIAEQAGGYASDGKTRIMEIQPEHLHDRCPLFIGNKDEVLSLEKVLAEYEVEGADK